LGEKSPKVKLFFRNFYIVVGILLFMNLEMNLGIGRFGHEVSGEFVSHEEAEKMFDETVYGEGFLGNVRKAYDSVRNYFSTN
jgi:hypothetical protein